jgi:chorismate synthase
MTSGRGPAAARRSPGTVRPGDFLDPGYTLRVPLRLTTAGESHGPRLTALLEGVPAGLRIDPEFVRAELVRRQHGYGRGGRMKIEQDEAVFEGGVRGSVTLGSPIAIGILNRDFAAWEPAMGPLSTDPEAVSAKRLTRPRPGHADLAGGMKFGASDLRNVLERASARESAARVAAGAVCKLLLRACGIEVRSGVLSLGPVVDAASPRCFASLERVRDESPLRAIDSTLEKEMVAAVDDARSRGDTLGGSILVGARGVPAGLGTFASWDRRLDGRLGQALLSVPAVKAVEFGSAIAASLGPGSAAHDEIEPGEGGALRRRTNRAGGLEAGVTNGEDVVAVVYMKPISTLARGLDSVDIETGRAARSAYERSDVTAVPACGVIAEAMVAFVLADALLESVGGDRLEDVTARVAAHRERVRLYPRGRA